MLVSELLLVGLAGLMIAQIIARFVFDYDFEIAEEYSAYLLAALSFISLAVGQAYDAYHRVEMVQARLSPRGRLLSALIFDLLTLAFVLLLLGYFLQLIWSSWTSGNISLTMAGTPLWIPQLSLPIGMTCFALVLARTVLRDWRALSQARAA